MFFLTKWQWGEGPVREFKRRERRGPIVLFLQFETGSFRGNEQLIYFCSFSS